MKNYKNKLLKCFLLIFFLILSFSINAVFVKADSINNYNQDQVDLDVKSAIAFDLNTKQILYAKNADKKLPVASMSKLITIYLTLDAIKNKKISWEQKIKPTRQIVAVSNNPEYSGVPLQLDHEYTIRQLYEATLIDSANGPAMLLGQAISGSQHAFVEKMRKQIEAWNINGGGTEVVTPSGLPNYSLGDEMFKDTSKDAENTLSASDMATIISHLLTDFPEVLKTTSRATSNFEDRGQTIPMKSSNWMLNGLSEYDSDYPVDGLKTGTTDAAGACFSATMQKNGRRIVTVVMGAKHADGNDPSRFIQTKKLMKYLFDHYQIKEIMPGTHFSQQKTVKVEDSKSKSAPIYSKKKTVLWLPKDSKISDLKVKFSKAVVSAPVDKGDKIGKFYFSDLPALNSSHGVEIEATIHKNIKAINPLVKLGAYIEQGIEHFYKELFIPNPKTNKVALEKPIKKEKLPYKDPKDLEKPGTWNKKSEEKDQPDLTKVKELWIRVSLKGNRTYIMSKDKPVYTMLSAGGAYHKNQSTTPTGTYHIQKERGNEFYNHKLNEGAKYYVSWKEHGVYLFHSVPTKHDGSINEAEAKNIGKSPGSHGCVRLSIPDAKWLAETVPIGTKVVIKDN